MVVPCYHLSSSNIQSSTVNIEIRECIKINGRLQEDKNNVKSLTIRPKKWSRLFGKLEVVVY